MQTVRIYSLCGGVVQSLSYAKFATPWIAAHQASLCFTISQSLLNLMSTVSRCHPIISSCVTPFSPALNLSQNQVAKVLKLQLRHESFQCIFRVDFL